MISRIIKAEVIIPTENLIILDITKPNLINFYYTLNEAGEWKLCIFASSLTASKTTKSRNHAPRS